MNRTLLAILADEADRLHCKDRDPVLAQCLGLILAGCLVLAWAALRITPKKIGA